METTPWLNQPQVEDPGDLSPGRAAVAEIPLDSAMAKVMDTFAECLPEEPDFEETTMAATEILQGMYAPIDNLIQNSGIDYRRVWTTARHHQLKGSEQKILTSLDIWKSETAFSMALENPELLAENVQATSNVIRDVIRMLSKDRPAYFEEAAQQELGHDWWKEIAHPDNRDGAWRVFQQVARDWSPQYVRQTAEEFTNETSMLVSERVEKWRKTLDQKEEGPDREFDRRFSTGLDAALDGMVGGVLQDNETLFKESVEEAMSTYHDSERYLNSKQSPN